MRLRCRDTSSTYDVVSMYFSSDKNKIGDDGALWSDDTLGARLRLGRPEQRNWTALVSALTIRLAVAILPRNASGA